jgi:hypothetical protein
VYKASGHLALVEAVYTEENAVENEEGKRVVSSKKEWWLSKNVYPTILLSSTNNA